jgi:hypothetical protein
MKHRPPSSLSFIVLPRLEEGESVKHVLMRNVLSFRKRPQSTGLGLFVSQCPITKIYELLVLSKLNWNYFNSTYIATNIMA